MSDAAAVFFAGRFLMKSYRPRALILTLYSGEQEFDRCCESIQAQDFGAAEHRVLRDLPNQQAHAELYAMIMRERENFDLFLKLDADMVLAHDGVLTRIGRQFGAIPNLDHLVLGVADWFTGRDIIGVHAFSNRVSWTFRDDGLFVDPDPCFSGRKIVIPHPRPVAVFHAPDPNSFQAFQFGVHRGMKACQRGLTVHHRQPYAARVHWSYLNQVWRRFQEEDDRRLGLALLGADLVFGGLSPARAGNRDDSDLRAAYQKIESIGLEEIHRRLHSNWSGWIARRWRWLCGMDKTMAPLVLVRALRDAVGWPIRALKHLPDRRAARSWADHAEVSDGTR